MLIAGNVCTILLDLLAHTALALPVWFAWDPLLTYFTSAFLLAVGVSVAIKNAPPQAHGLDKFILLGPVFFAMPMGAFGTEHFLAPVEIGSMVPDWIPWHLFWAYFVGTCLILGGLSIVLRKHAGVSAGLAGLMFLLFVVLMDIPGVVATPHDRFSWALAFRESSFGWGGLSLAATQTEEWKAKGTHWLVPLARTFIGMAILFYAFEHFRHPEFAPGVPLSLVTPPWVPAASLWGYLTALIFTVGGVCVITNKQARLAAGCIGLWLLLIVLVILVPVMIQYGSEIGKGFNNPADTLMFSGAVLCLAGSLRERPGAPQHEQQVARGHKNAPSL